MKPCLAALLADVIDYAGLFPPAALQLDPAIRNFAAYRKSPQAALLGRFVIPAAKLGDLSPYRDSLFAENPPTRFSILAGGGESAEQFFDAMKRDISAVDAFEAQHGDRVRVEAFELKLPANLLRTRDGGAIRGFIRRTCEALHEAKHLKAAAFFETPLIDDWRAIFDSTASSAAQAQAELSKTGCEVMPAMKLRTGGLEAAAFPSSEQIAVVIRACLDHGVPLKFTAGLHHAIRRFDPGVRAMMHGFLNLYLAGVLAHAVALEVHDIQAIIDEQDAREFVINDSSLAWNDAEAMLDEVRVARRSRLISFGSCSFDEPVDELRALGLL